MNRRELLKMVAIVTGGSVVGGSAFLLGCGQEGNVPETFTQEEIAFLDEVAETILPETRTPGAKAAKVGSFMALMVSEGYDRPNQIIFHDGMREINRACAERFGHEFMGATPAQRTTLLTETDRERKEFYDRRHALVGGQFERAGRAWNKINGKPDHYFQQMKQLALMGFFTSEVGRKEALRYVPVPGKWESVIDYKKGDKAFVGLN